MKQWKKPNTISMLGMLTVVLVSTLAVTLFNNRMDAADPTEPFVVPTPTTRPWEAR